MRCGSIAANISLADRKAHFLVDIDVRLNSGIAKAKSWKRVPLRRIHQAMQRDAEFLATFGLNISHRQPPWHQADYSTEESR
jgi:hypothetical protein